MKLLFLTNIPSPYRLNFFNELGREHELQVIFEAERNTEINEKWYQGKIENFKAIFLKKGNINEKKFNWKILKYLNRKEQDYIIVTNYSYFTELLALVIIKLKKIPYLMEIDGGLIKQENKLLKKIKTFLIKNANGYFSPSKESDKFLIYYGAESNKIYRYPFTSLYNDDILDEPLTSSEKSDIREKLGLKETNIVLTVCQFIPRKGLDILIKACKNIPKDTAICIIGGNPTEEYLSLVENLGLKSVYFLGFKSKEELKEYYKASDLFVLPTREDIWGLVINESMAYGLPVITTSRCGAGIELVGNDVNGFIVPVEDSPILSEKIKLILNNNDIKEKMARNSLQIIKQYSLENMARRHTEILDNIEE